jgi:Phosphotransferase System HPr (HPr) Family
MYKRTTTIKNELGLHARTASSVVKIATQFNSLISINMGEKRGLAKSIFSIMALGAKKGAELEIEAEGIDEEEAVKALVDFIDGGCGENV